VDLLFSGRTEKSSAAGGAFCSATKQPPQAVRLTTPFGTTAVTPVPSLSVTRIAPIREACRESAKVRLRVAGHAAVYGGRVERVWDYPRPPAVTPCERRVRAEWAGEMLADSRHALRVLETSHPPTIYIPPADVRLSLLSASDAGPTWCEFKGEACYLDAIVDGRRAHAIAWSYPQPSGGYEALRDHIAFYPGRLDAAWLDDERVQAQPGDFYGGWITGDLVGPFKGTPGTRGW
jgi:uncharacterized protein (DUF427 family)